MDSIKDALIEQQIRFLTKSDTDDKAIELVCSKCSTVQQKVKAGQSDIA